MKVALLYIAIGEYTVFFDSFYRSCEKYFLPNTEKEYFVFSDRQEKSFKRENVTVIETSNMGWPDNTLKRFHLFMSIESELQRFEYCFFFNANLEFVKSVSEKILPEHGIIVVQHPGFYNKTKREFPYDRNRKSKACISENEGTVYVCGGVNGGTVSDYIKMCRELRERIDQDYANGIVAIWHDESHLNRYICDLDSDEFVVWNPGFCYPDFCRMPFEEICHLKDKSYYINIDKKKKQKFINVVYRNLFTNQRFFKIRRYFFRKKYEQALAKGKDLGVFVDKKK